MANAPSLPDCYAGFVLSTIELHKRLIECIDQITDDTLVMYLNMVMAFLCALNKMELLDAIEEKFGTKLFLLDPPQFRKAATWIFQEIGPPPEVNLEGDC